MQRFTLLARGIAGAAPLSHADLKTAAEGCFLLSAVFILPLLLFFDWLPVAAKVLLQLCWGALVWRGFVLAGRHGKPRR